MVPPATLARLFLRLGATAFGGPAAHIALLHQDVVRRRGWLSDAEFGDLLAATNLIPGPNSTEMALHVGRRVGGWAGFLVAGLCFILPATVIVAALAAMYVRYGDLPDVRAAMTGIAPVVVAIVVHALARLAPATARRGGTGLIVLAAAALSLAGVNELAVLAGAGLVMAAAARSRGLLVLLVAVSTVVVHAQSGGRAADAVPLLALSLFFLKVGSILFGSGYVLVAFLRADLVSRWHWLTDQQLLDAIAAGQMTPGPLSTTATFIGYLLGGWPGAILSTIAIFLPAFVFVAATQPLLPRLRRAPVASAFLDGVVAASVGLLAAVAFTLAHAALVDPASVIVAAVALLLLFRWNVNSIWLISGGAVLGLVLPPNAWRFLFT